MSEKIGHKGIFQSNRRKGRNRKRKEYQWFPAVRLRKYEPLRSRQINRRPSCTTRPDFHLSSVFGKGAFLSE